MDELNRKDSALRNLPVPGILKSGNATIFIGAEEEKNKLLRLEKKCKAENKSQRQITQPI